MTQEFVTMPRTVVERALEALHEAHVLIERFQDEKLRISAMEAPRAALEQPQVEQEPDSNERVMTVVYRDPTREDVQSFMDHPKAVWFGWCHAPYQRDDARAQLEQPPRQPMTDEQIVAMWEFPRDLSWMDSVVRLAHAIERTHGIK